ncbi:MAG: histidine kinase [Alistipes sp.]|nr:histidine kinase [Alistipes sp.]
MKATARHSNSVGLHLLVAVALSLVINFSYLLMPLITQRGGVDSRSRRNDDATSVIEREGTLHLSRDMHGYITYDDSTDSIYVSSWQVGFLKLEDGDRLVVSVQPLSGFPKHRIAGAHPRLNDVILRNGEEFDFEAIYDRPSKTSEFIWQILYYAVVSFILLSIMTLPFGAHRQKSRTFARRLMLSLALTGVLFFFAPVVCFHPSRIVTVLQADLRPMDYMVVLLKCVFMFVVTALYSRIYALMRQREAITVENERLKNEYLSTRYNMLISQINPHFFFNSLNSLSMLVREGDSARSLEYIDQLSYTFRYIIQNGQTTSMTLTEEMDFAEAYIYLFKIRYADKLFFDIDIDPAYAYWTLPALSLQPLIGNTVKHNSITTRKPLRVRIFTEDGRLVITNPKHPKLENEPSTGIGLENLRNRWHIITGRDIEIEDLEDRFTVRLPLQPPLKP